ncbi:MAG: T9SS type A sorting domain-containing protein [Candidatus Desantisbacteria bacterium]
MSSDPNDKAGPTGFGENHWVLPDQTFQYVIYFENLGTATAPAQEIKLADQLDSNLDWTTLEFDDICIGDRIIGIPEERMQISTSTIFSLGTWSGGIPETRTVRLQIQGSVTDTGLVQWKLDGRDISTGELTDLLVPNTNPPCGEGWVSFTIMPKKDLSSNTQIKNKATIVFDTNQPINTPEIFNTIDSGFPTSSVAALPEFQHSPNFTIGYSGTDDHGGSGIRNYTIYLSDNGGTYTAWHQEIISTPSTTFSGSATFKGEYGHTYRFYSRVTDAVGNLEPIPAAFQAETTLIATAIRIEADRKVIPVNGTTTLYCLAQGGTGTVPATWTVTGNIGTLSTIFGTSTIFYATSMGIGTITATDGTNTAIVTIIVGNFGSDLTGVVVYPNPFKLNRGDTEVRFERLTKNVTIRIYNIAGELVRREENITNSFFNWDLTNGYGEKVSSGVYIYVITDDEKRIKKGKIAIIR